jgi:hypothetical protein
MAMFWAMLIKPLVAVVLFGLALWLSQMVIALIPEGRIKRLLTRPIGRQATDRRWR